MPFTTADTIVAIATPPGRAGLGVVRLSGSRAQEIAQSLLARTTPLVPRYATFCRILNADSSISEGRASDRVIATFFPGPHSYTGEDVAEISAHGSPVVLSGIVRSAMEAGARLAEPGEFTLRAFLNGKLDLIQAEAVADLIEAVTPQQARAAFDQLEGTLTTSIAEIEEQLFDLMARLEASLDFAEEGYHFIDARQAESGIDDVTSEIDRLLAQSATGRLLREGAQVAIVGAPNVGKSSLFNALLNADRAIVTEIPGTTRDLLAERANVGGLAIALIDTAGVRESADIIEQEGVSRALGASRVADLLLLVVDSSRPVGHESREALRRTEGRKRIVVINKADLTPAWPPAAIEVSDPIVCLSCRTREGLETLISTIQRSLTDGEPLRDSPAVTNVRHTRLLQQTRDALARARAAIAQAVPEEFPLIDLQEAIQSLQEISGKRTTDDLLRRIFERFCIGK